MDLIKTMEETVLRPPSDGDGWDRLGSLFSGIGFLQMKTTPQDPVYHAEGDVMTHTRMVCEKLLSMPEFQRLPIRQRAGLFLAALLHDIGKVKTTRIVSGTLAAPFHAPSGSRIVRASLIRDFGLCGTPEYIDFRETVCALIRYHMTPLHLSECGEPAFCVRKTASVGELAHGFSPELLYLLAEADSDGRIAGNKEESAACARIYRAEAEDAGCLDGPYPFPDGYTKRAYFSGRNVCPDQPLFDSTWGEIAVMSGLPGTGKDEWIKNYLQGLPVVSPDAIRKELGVKPTDPQGRVFSAAFARAKEHLRNKTEFVWNATDLTENTRAKIVDLIERYGARARIVYLETGRDERIKRNAKRAGAVPEKAVDKMTEKTVPPLSFEAQTVEWICV